MNLPHLSIDKQKSFIRNYLQSDGIVVLQIISDNTNDVVMSHLLSALYNLHCNSMKKDFHSDDQLQSNEHYMHTDSSSI